MADSYTDFLNLTKPEIAGSKDAWGDKWNANADTIALWAKGADALVKDSLGLARVNKAADGSTIAWPVAGPVDFAAAAKFAAGMKLPDNQFLSFATAGFFGSDGKRTILAATGDRFEVVNAANNAFLLQVAADGISYKGQGIYHTGNLDPTLYLPKAGGTMAGPLVLGFPSPYFDLANPGVIRSRQVVGNDGTWILRDGDSGDNKLYVTVNGAVWTKQFGDLSSRIDARAAAFADDRSASTRTWVYNNFVGNGGQNTMGPGFIVAGSAGNGPYMDLVSGGIYRWRHQVHDDALLVWKNGDNGDIAMYLPPSGDLYLKAFGKTVGAQIEARAAAFADDRLNTATARINNKSARLTYVQDVSIGDVGNSTLWEGVGGGVLTGFQQNGSTGYARLFRVRQLQMSDSNGNYYACGYA